MRIGFPVSRPTFQRQILTGGDTRRASSFNEPLFPPYFRIANLSPNGIYMAIGRTHFEWDSVKDGLIQQKHGVSFAFAQHAFADPQRVILLDEEHSVSEQRFSCLGKVGDGVLTVRFTYRNNIVRIFEAGYWRKGNKLYEEQNHIH